MNENAEIWATVKNTSDKADTIVFTAKSESGDLSLHGDKAIYLEAGASGRVKVLIAEPTRLPSAGEEKMFTANVSASSRLFADSTQSFAISILNYHLPWRDLAKDATISGRVYDKGTGAPIAGATVVTKLWSRETEQQTTTNSEGSFQILLPSYDWLSQELFQNFALHNSAEYVVAVHVPGYQSAYQTGVKPKPGSSLNLGFNLEKLKVSASFSLSWEKELEYPGVWRTAVSDDWNHLAVAMGKHPDPGDKTVATNVYSFDSAGNRQWSYPIGDAAWGIDITGDGAKVAVGSFDKNAYVFDGKGNLLWKYTSDTIREVRFSHNGAYLAFGPTKRSAEWFALFDSSTGKMLWERQVGGWVRFIAFSEDDSLIAVGSEGDLALFDINGGLKWRRYIAGIPFYIGISSDLSRIFVVDKGQLVSTFDAAGNLLWSRTIELPTEGAMSRDGSKIVVLNIRGSVFTFDRDGNLLWHRDFEDAGHEGLSITRDGKYIILGGGNNRYPFWTALLTPEGTVLWENRISATAPQDIHPYQVATMHVAMSEDYTRIVSGYGSFRPALRLFKGSISSIQ